MSYISDVHAATRSARAEQRSSTSSRRIAPSLRLHPLYRATARLSEALEATVLVATLSGLSLVIATVAAGAF